MKEVYLTAIITVVCSVLGSAGFWAFLSKRHDAKDYKSDMLRGLAHDRIMTLGMYYIRRGYITPDEYENLYEYLYLPYEALGGNGSAKRVVDEVKKLPFKPNDRNDVENTPDLIVDH